MGDISIIFCRKCKEDKYHILTGVGFMGSSNDNIYPGSCLNCKKVVSVDLLKKPYLCPDCNSKVDLYNFHSKENTEKNLCPACNEQLFYYKDMGSWD